MSAAVVVASKEQEFDAVKAGWCGMDVGQQVAIQNHWECATFDGINSTSVQESCNKAELSQFPANCRTDAGCDACYPHLIDQIQDARILAGGVSLGLCFFELLAISFAVHYRRASVMEWAKERGFTREIL